MKRVECRGLRSVYPSFRFCRSSLLNFSFHKAQFTPTFTAATKPTSFAGTCTLHNGITYLFKLILLHDGLVSRSPGLLLKTELDFASLTYWTRLCVVHGV